MKKFWQFLCLIGAGLAYIFYALYSKEKDKNADGRVVSAEQEADRKAVEKNEKVRDNFIDTANDIADILNRKL